MQARYPVVTKLLPIVRKWKTKLDGNKNESNDDMYRQQMQITEGMQPIAFAVPRHVVQQRFRPPKKNIPQSPGERSRILHAIRNYVAEHNPAPPMPLAEPKVHADRLITTLGCDSVYRDYIGVLIS